MDAATLVSVARVLGLVFGRRKGRIRLVTTFAFDDNPDTPDEIAIVNLSDVHVQVSRWTLAWKPNFLSPWLPTIDVTPREGTSRFTILPNSDHTLRFAGDDKFDWSYRSAQHRKLYLTLHLFDRRPFVLKVGAGQ